MCKSIKTKTKDKFILKTLTSFYKELPLSVDDRKYVLDHIRKRLFFSFKTPPVNSMKNLFGLACITITHKNTVLCRVGAKATLWQSLDAAITAILKNIDNLNQRQTFIHCALLFSPKQYEVDEIENAFHIGLDSIQFVYRHSSAIYKNNVALKRRLSTKQTLESLCVKAGCKLSVIKEKACCFILYKTLEFEEDKCTKKCQDLFRGRELILPSEVTPARLQSSLLSIDEFFKKNLLSPIHSAILNNNNANISDNIFSFTARFIASLISYLDISRYLKQSVNWDTIYQRVKILISPYIIDTNDYHYISINGEALLGINSLYLILLTYFPAYKQSLLHQEKLSCFLLSLYNKKTGAFYVGWPDVLTAKIQPNAHYIAPAQALLAIQLCQTHQAISIKKIIKKSIQYYYQQWNVNQPLEMTAWFSKACSLAFDRTKSAIYVNFVHDMNRNVIKQQLTAQYAEPDCVGAFSYQGDTKSTAFFLESLTEAYRLAIERKNKGLAIQYQESIILGLRMLLQNQLVGNNTIVDKQLTGGFTRSVTDLTVEIDTAQHAASAILNALTFNIV